MGGRSGLRQTINSHLVRGTGNSPIAECAGLVEADQLTQISQELGNKNAAIVFLATDAVMTALGNRQRSVENTEKEETSFSPEKPVTSIIPARTSPPMALSVAIATDTKQSSPDQENTSKDREKNQAALDQAAQDQHEAALHQREKTLEERRQQSMKVAEHAKTAGEKFQLKFKNTRTHDNDDTNVEGTEVEDTEEEETEVEQTVIADLMKAATIIQDEFIGPPEQTNAQNQYAPIDPIVQGKITQSQRRRRNKAVQNK